jgi:hypothetical protein
MVEPTQKQCTSNDDCVARGLAGTACVANLCQALMPAAGTDGTSGTGGTGGIDGAVAGSGGADTGAAGRAGADSIDSGSPGTVVMNAGSGAAGSSGAAAGKSGMAGGNGGAGGAGTMASSAGAAGCAGASCGECAQDGDCVERLGANATCVDRTCFAPEAQCEVDEDCVARGPEYKGGRCADRQCLPNPKWRCEPAPIPATPMVDLIVPVIDALQLSYVPDVPLVACSKLDYECAQPVVKAMTGTDGRAKLSVPANFSGYVQQVESTSYGPGLYFPPALLPMDKELRNFPIFRNGSTAALGLALGAALDPERGHIMLVSEDCMGNAVPGVAFTTPQADTKTVQFYVRGQIPTTSAVDTPPEGTGGYMNLPPGVVVITAKEVKSGIELSTTTVLVRAGVISMLYVRPISRGTTMTGVGGH